MGWVKRNEPGEPVEVCTHPRTPKLHSFWFNEPLASTGDRWECDDCGMLFVVADRLDWYGARSELRWRQLGPRRRTR